jgi:bifunctional NMN adenylyltransferase/nudix hydrolase
MNEIYEKPYELGMYMGRFGIWHNGHDRVARAALAMCDRLLIIVGSAQEKGTIRNPFDVQTRMEMIRECFPNKDQVIIKALEDFTSEDDVCPEWGEYLVKNAKAFGQKMPELMVYGNDESRSGWFKTIHWTELIMSREEYPYSATKGREDLLRNRREEWNKNHHRRLHKFFDRLRGELLEAPPYSKALTKLIDSSKILKPWEDYGYHKEDILEGQMDFE